jgi:integrase/recombinase XerD
LRFFRYLYRVDLMTRDLGKAIESPRRYRLASLPRSITWNEVEQMLQNVDRRSAVGKRDYAILLLLVTYGLRAREVGALTLDDIDWKRDRLDVRGR